MNGGTCVDGLGSFTCNCLAGFTGNRCEEDMNECASLPCQNGAECRDFVNSYTCACPTGFSGVNCQTNDNDCSPSYVSVMLTFHGHKFSLFPFLFSAPVSTEAPVTTASTRSRALVSTTFRHPTANTGSSLVTSTAVSTEARARIWREATSSVCVRSDFLGLVVRYVTNQPSSVLACLFTRLQKCISMFCLSF